MTGDIIPDQGEAREQASPKFKFHIETVGCQIRIVFTDEQGIHHKPPVNDFFRLCRAGKFNLTLQDLETVKEAVRPAVDPPKAAAAAEAEPAPIPILEPVQDLEPDHIKAVEPEPPTTGTAKNLKSWLAAKKAEGELKKDKEVDVPGIFQQGGEWQTILAGLHHKVVGEDNLLRAMVLSGLSAFLPDGKRFCVYTNASSQMGKSYTAYATAETLFSDRVLWQQSFSPKAFYYEAKENPYWMAGKIMVLDELADLSEETRAILKPLMSLKDGQEMHHLTVDKKGQAEDLVIKAAPVFWANSAKLAEDAGFQLSNRFLKMGIDESQAQTDAINTAICHNAQVGPFQPHDRVSEAQAIIRAILRFRPSNVLIPMAPCVKVEGEARNIMDLFLSMVAACAYLHHHRRAKLITDGGETLLASASDVLEASDLWNSFLAQRNRGASGKYLRVMEAIRAWYHNNPTLAEVENPSHPTVDDITRQYNAMPGNESISGKTVNNTLGELADRNLVNQIRPEGTHFYIYELPPGKEDIPQISVSLANSSKIYDQWVGEMADYKVSVPDEVREQVLDVSQEAQQAIELTLAQIIETLKGTGREGFTKGQVLALRDDPDRGIILFDELVDRGIIGKNPTTKRWNYLGQGRK